MQKVALIFLSRLSRIFLSVYYHLNPLRPIQKGKTFQQRVPSLIPHVISSLKQKNKMFTGTFTICKCDSNVTPCSGGKCLHSQSFQKSSPGLQAYYLLPWQFFFIIFPAATQLAEPLSVQLPGKQKIKTTVVKTNRKTGSKAAIMTSFQAGLLLANTMKRILQVCLLDDLFLNSTKTKLRENVNVDALSALNKWTHFFN